ncbi:transposase-like zinc-binding protein [Desulfobotulus alkaliphilus]|uniref:Transposase-like zinc-binding protein n=1 Tax=Desulfobotulus alkaliphilus TaxID=622671 RepID=A0A562R282_9BACT|nr:IS91 family transposase [Desulfobotulus alkaliphilus]TWI63151.1 transposase-like zinc-binding protein [Desulfobotulus alkaliphilus]
MKIIDIINEYYEPFVAMYGGTLLPGQMKALHAMRGCRSGNCGELFIQCTDCGHQEWRPLSCGHRNCPQCQHHEASQWIGRQQEKLLPVDYFMVTFTLPYELRELAYRHQKTVFSIFFSCVSSTLKDFGLRPKNLGAEIGMTMVLHTHSRKLDYHPHLHVVIPGGGIDKKRNQWKKKKGKYLFNEKALAKVFRARFLDSLNKEGLTVPRGIRSEWVVKCKGVGKGLPAIKYLSSYLYRGVISEKNIISSKDGMVTFRYTENTGKIRYRTLKGEDFLRLILKHVLPKGFRRIRDYGFLHCKAKKLLSLVQHVLRVQLESINPVPRASFSCPRCKAPMEVLFFLLRPG